MKTMIYQFWDGEDKPGVLAGTELMREYADNIKSDYIFEKNPRWQKNLGRYSPHYGAFKPIFDEKMSKYDYVLFVDTDVVPRKSLNENIFDQFKNTDYDIGICEEWNAPKTRLNYTIAGINNTNDEKWVSLIEKTYSVKMPRTKEKLPKAFNSGVIVYSKNGMEKFRNNHITFKDYVSLIDNSGLPSFYTCDQPYIHSMLEICKFKWKIMNYKWNSSVHFKPGTKNLFGMGRPVIDLRNNHNFVHIQLNGKNGFSKDKINRIVNLPVEDWVLNS
jgi:hypothetical protein